MMRIEDKLSEVDKSRKIAIDGRLWITDGNRSIFELNSSASPFVRF